MRIIRSSGAACSKQNDTKCGRLSRVMVSLGKDTHWSLAFPPLLETHLPHARAWQHLPTYHLLMASITSLLPPYCKCSSFSVPCGRPTRQASALSTYNTAIAILENEEATCKGLLYYHRIKEWSYSINHKRYVSPQSRSPSLLELNRNGIPIASSTITLGRHVWCPHRP